MANCAMFCGNSQFRTPLTAPMRLELCKTPFNIDELIRLP